MDMRPRAVLPHSRRRLRVLFLVYGELGERAAGPEMRGWALARALAGRHEVTVAVQGADGRPAGESGLRVVPATRRRLAREMLRHDVLVAPCVPPFLLAAKALRRMVVVSDQYDPVELELGTLDSREGAADLRSARHAARLQLDAADIVLCAGERQRRRLAGRLAQAARRGPDPALVVVPFGIPPAPAGSGRRPIRERIPDIAPSDTVVLWWGSIWRWLDAETAIRAFAPLSCSRPDIKLVLTAGRPPGGDLDRLTATERARSLADSLGLLDRTVFFLDEWIPYGERHHHLLEADIGLTLHHDTAEAAVAARARYMDYLWSGLPCVLARGDDIAEQFGHAGFATLVDPHDPEAASRAVLRLANDPAARAQGREAGEALAEESRWEAAAQPLVEALDGVGPERLLAPQSSAAVIAGASAYYARRVVDELSA